MTCGALYVGPKQPYFDDAVTSARTLRETNDFPVSIVTIPELAEAEDTSIFDEVIVIRECFDDVRDPPYNFDKTPYDKTIFLDSDTLVVSDISSVFDLLDRVDVAATMSPHRNTIDMPDIPESFPKFNTGVVAYSSTEDLWEMVGMWKSIIAEQISNGRPRPGETISYDKYETLAEMSKWGNAYDESAFREAIYKSKVTWSMLPPEYNFGKMGRGDTREEVKILHGKYREQLQNIVNERDVPRVIVGNKLYFIYGNNVETVRLEGVPVVDPLIYYLRLPYVTKKLGVHKPMKWLYQSISGRLGAG